MNAWLSKESAYRPSQSGPVCALFTGRTWQARTADQRIKSTVRTARAAVALPLISLRSVRLARTVRQNNPHSLNPYQRTE